MTNPIKTADTLLFNYLDKLITVKLPKNKKSFVDSYNHADIECAPGSFGYEFEKMAKRDSA